MSLPRCTHISIFIENRVHFRYTHNSCKIKMIFCYKVMNHAPLDLTTKINMKEEGSHVKDFGIILQRWLSNQGYKTQVSNSKQDPF